MTLAQRLNELAAANSEGLLKSVSDFRPILLHIHLLLVSDDEYRLLRQNLFERFASNAAVPTEAPVVPVSRPSTSGGSTYEGRRMRHL